MREETAKEATTFSDTGTNVASSSNIVDSKPIVNSDSELSSNTGVEEDRESMLSAVGSSNNSNLSEYYVSSDAETEKMENTSGAVNVSIDEPPKLSDLIPDEDENKVQLNKRSVEEAYASDKGNSSGFEGDREVKKIKVLPEPVLETEQQSISADASDVADTEKVAPEEDVKLEESAVADDQEPSATPANIVEKEEENVNEEHEQEPEPEPDFEIGTNQEIDQLEGDGEDAEVEDVEDDDEDEKEMIDNHSSLNTYENNASEEDMDAGDMAKGETVSPMVLEETRLLALKEITDIEYRFAELRQKLYDNKLVRLQTELQMCLEGSHPELQKYYTKIASIRDYKLRRAYTQQKYELKCIDEQTRATRTFIHQDFYKKAIDLRNNMLNNTTQQWYDINKERRDMDITVPTMNYHVPVKIAGKTLSCITGYAGPAQQRYAGEELLEDFEAENIKFSYRSNPVDKLEVIVDRMRTNNELSDLAGLKKFYNGFPGAPDLNGLKDIEVLEDLQNIRQVKL
ncbi:hypothetical protein TPHA_0L00560 [Tetrapisispora phaffii CBS 4417]|uniref:Transcriptional regulatory protein DEP1 n=1 Tax=Tetrapisispora phaffii (strain ATCC 24235 / CBS 4417 / NBRC 1672 / NRRL Y-8282 / UCD 70-5) TaxID=1071381 RepID=G8BZT4_TETPH|nr:hypothetical protein TPHA_0L00560 [Tetrapisispora phaffii CBS 4417]CCE65412.1 hypothetical protein TPHA_0L00560 [Tetrapisispora phaffii CBS 4417]